MVVGLSLLGEGLSEFVNPRLRKGKLEPEISLMEQPLIIQLRIGPLSSFLTYARTLLTLVSIFIRKLYIKLF